MILQVGVKAFLKNEDGKYLLLKRSSEKYKGTKGSWDIVGGRIEPGTRLLENLKREVKEETGLEIISEPQLLDAQDIILGADRHVVRLTYTAQTKGEPILDISENIEYKWMTIAEIRKQADLDIYVAEILKKKLP
ncbi:MAG: NUDIX hydrolase [Candidatus Pacebacteria bacterium]|nr:NUDIX hydrolase [Candidatus Paceibacterota bacterium]